MTVEGPVSRSSMRMKGFVSKPPVAGAYSTTSL
jgi:hypothetical protein